MKLIKPQPGIRRQQRWGHGNGGCCGRWGEEKIATVCRAAKVESRRIICRHFGKKCVAVLQKESINSD